jgi:hypothetical protein
VKIGRKEKAAVSLYHYYLNIGHLAEVANSYTRIATATTASHVGWYNFSVPQLDTNMVKRDFLSVQEVVGYFGESAGSIKELISKGNVQSYILGNYELVRRPELNEILNLFPLNVFKEYPA